MKTTTQEIKIGERLLILEHGLVAQQANSSILARYGDTMVLVTVVASANDTNLDYFPLTVEYVERLYAGGRIKGSRWIKREGRPLDEHILTARLIDRSIRPLFPKSYKKEVQVVATILSVDLENDPQVLSMVATSAALATSSIPWDGPVGSLRVGLENNNYVANPVESKLKFSDLDLILTSNEKAILMIEAGARQVPEEQLLNALEFGQKEVQNIISGIKELVKKVGVKKDEYEEAKDSQVVDLIKKKYTDNIERFLKEAVTTEGRSDLTELKNAIAEEVSSENAHLISDAIEKVKRQIIREKILSGTRLDGRRPDEIRPLYCTVGILSRTHGSAIFQRGQTQVLSATTLGSPSLEQTIESATGEEAKRYIHYYSMPPYATGETGRMGSPSRREIGHGALSERALIPIIPTEEQFPYTIQVVSEVLSSNGSTSMASVCGSTLSLMDAGVPISAPVSGIAMGAVIEGDKAVILSDIMGIEDANGDMDFKVAGTRDGVTSIQLDVKTPHLTLQILKTALDQARKDRLFILEKMCQAIDKPRSTLSTYAPKITVVKIPTEKIGEVIGPGGRVIRKIMADTETQVDVEDDGSVTISGVNQEFVDKARQYIESLVKEVQPGEKYKGTVKRIQAFGAFVEVLPGKDGLVHISDMAEEFVKDPRDVVNIGQEVEVTVKEIDELGRINLTMLPEGKRNQPPRDRGRDPRFQKRERQPGGPHFPASRLVPSKRRF